MRRGQIFGVAAALLGGAVLVASMAGPARAGSPVPALAGLKGVTVSIFHIHDPVARTIASEESLRALVEGRLRQDGIRILPEPKDWDRPSPDDARLWVLWNPLVDPDGTVTYSIDLYLVQFVKLARKPGTTVSAITWNPPNLIGRSRPWQREEIRESVLRVVDQFARAYWDSNPKP